jgi:hypothetical protein
MPTVQAPSFDPIVCDGFHIDPPCEEQQMTFHAAFIGSNGLIVGGDRLMFYATQDSSEPNPASQTTETQKFIKSQDEGITCFYAGGQLAKNIAVNICNQTAPSGQEIDWENILPPFLRSLLLMKFSLCDETLQMLSGW